MSDNDGQDPASSNEQARKTAAEAGPVGRTRKEEQRRRLIVTGLATPALMSLPSRRVWASKCTKSKLLSGNLSAKKKSTDCDPMGCKRDFWKKGQPIKDIDWTVWDFDQTLYPGAMTRQQIYNGSENMLEVVSSLDPPHVTNYDGASEMFPYYGGGGEVDAVKHCAREAAACFLNWYFINWPAPNDMFNFDLTDVDVRFYWRQAVDHALAMSDAAIAEKEAKAAGKSDLEKAEENKKKAAKAELNAVEDIFKAANDRVCPF